MQSTLQAHLLHLEGKIQELSDKLTDPACALAERVYIESEIRLAELAIGHYLKAFELEQKIT